MWETHNVSAPSEAEGKKEQQDLPVSFAAGAWMACERRGLVFSLYCILLELLT